MYDDYMNIMLEVYSSMNEADSMSTTERVWYNSDCDTHERMDDTGRDDRKQSDAAANMPVASKHSFKGQALRPFPA